MAQIVGLIGNQGGTGKTTLTHMLCHGLGLLSQHAVAVLTDLGRAPLAQTNRRYLPFDGRADEGLAKVVAKLKPVESWIGVIDGGANRVETDRRLYDLATVALLAFRDSHEDMRTVLTDLESYPNACALPTQWPANARQLEAPQRSMEPLMETHRNRILAPVPAISASKLLLQHEPPAQLPSNLNHACRRIAAQVLGPLQLPFERELDPPDETAETSAVRVAA